MWVSRLTVQSQPLSTDLRNAWRNLVVEVKVRLIHGEAVRKARKYRDSDDLKLNLACGPNSRDGWVNVDMRKEADLALDLRRPFPFRDDSCSLIYAEHFFEHLDYPNLAGRFLKECLRVLKPGGVLSLVVPDIELVLQSTLNGGTPEYYEAQKRWHPDWCETQIEHLNYNFRQYNEHRFCYDYATLERSLARTGFTGIRRREFDAELDSPERIVGSLYADCVKPGGAVDARSTSNEASAESTAPKREPVAPA